MLALNACQEEDMTIYAKSGITALCALALVGLLTGIGWAGAIVLVQIDDLTEATPSVALQFAPPGLAPTIRPDTAGEFLHFTLPVSTGAPATTFYSDLFEDVVGGTLSDRLLVSHTTGSALVDVQFASDPATITLPPGASNRFNLLETGAFQSLGVFDQYDFLVRSDRADVPAPATIFLLGFGLVALGAATLRYRRRA
jgi:hypothetical protein